MHHLVNTNAPTTPAVAYCNLTVYSAIEERAVQAFESTAVGYGFCSEDKTNRLNR
jgi:hypothetical protein